MENAIGLRARRIVYKFGLIWFLVNSSIVSIGLYLSHWVQYDDLLSIPAMLVLIGLVLALSQGILLRKYFQAYLRLFKLGRWASALVVGLILTFLIAVASQIVALIPGFLSLGAIGTSAPPPPGFDSTVESLKQFSKFLFVLGSIIGGGTTGLLQLVIIGKHIKLSDLWPVATALSGGLNGLIYFSFQSGLIDQLNRPYPHNFDPVLAVASAKIGVVYGSITSVAMMVMLQATIKHQAQSS